MSGLAGSLNKALNAEQEGSEQQPAAATAVVRSYFATAKA
jgi:hypothetical protein